YPKEMKEFVQTGIASWYGPGFHGKQTANGEIYNSGDLTAAHKTLQLPSIIRVTNLENGRSAILRVNDRGPFAHDRILDVSEKGAEMLGFKNKGKAKIKLELLEEESSIVADAAKSGRDTRGIEVALNRQAKTHVARHLDEHHDMGWGRELTVVSTEPMQIPPALNPPIENTGMTSVYKNTVTTSEQVFPSDYDSAVITPVNPTIAAQPLENRPIVVSNQLPPTSNSLGTIPATYQQASTLPVADSGYYIQVGSFSNQANARNLTSSLSDIGPTEMVTIDRNGLPIHKVRVGPLPSQQVALNILPQIVDRGYSDAIVVAEQ
ncbi:MAG: hypothetical protein CL565_04425, partial [Alphaproteobacteria bacterium]|nr:hypothetical protein [Alphaproteobacteria bacterium]